MYIINILIKAQSSQYYFCQNVSTYTPNSTYGRNLDATLSFLPNTNSGYGFYNFSVGQGPDTANAISLCRGDAEPGMCQSCLNESIVQLRQACPNQREAIIYNDYDICYLWYSNATLLGNFNMDHDLIYLCDPNSTTSNKEQLNELLLPFMSKLSREAAAGGSLLKFAMGNVTSLAFPTIYGLTQCVPNLSGRQCSDCLEYTISQIPSYCDGNVGGSMGSPSCTIRFQIYRFDINTSVIPPPPSPPSPPPSPVLLRSHPVPPTGGKNSNTARTLSVIIIPTVGVIIMASICIFMVLRRKRKPIMKFESKYPIYNLIFPVITFLRSRLFYDKKGVESHGHYQ
ncbi:hypothetical protein L6452_31196 [Arctium lappa]|uniref:Uncharacterized protein n=1 Tax=Arctium lappa TaxID=4217 RepID=A0ACB8ZJC8_ARCLA|nr:hypothetical protein L6452_31196 [Arctium lappa]